MNVNNFLLRVMWFVKCWSHFISHYPVTFVSISLFELEIYCFLFVIILHIATIRESCDFVHGGPIP